MMAHWDFEKAQNLEPLVARESLRTKDKSLARLRAILSVSGVILSHRLAEEPLRKREGVFYFESGLNINPETKDSWMTLNGKPLETRPASVFYVEDGKLVEMKNEGRIGNMSALLFEANEIQMAALAEESLIRTMLYQLTYLGGEMLQFFKPFIVEFDEGYGRYIYVFKVDWDALSLAT